MTTRDALRVIHAAEARLGREFSHEEVTTKLGELLVDEDYEVLNKVIVLFSYLLAIVLVYLY